MLGTWDLILGLAATGTNNTDLLPVAVLFALTGYIYLCVLVGNPAARKGHSALGWRILSIFVTPIIGGIGVSFLKPTEEARIAAGDLIRCPRCDEAIRPAAAVCHFCGAQV